MPDTIILLTGPVEATALTAALRGHNARLTIHHAATFADLDAIGEHVLRRARLIAFVTPVVVPLRILNALGYGAYNFHPGPPEYPGWAPAHFAIYDRAREFGATAHAMIEQVDAGPIVAVEYFTVQPHMTTHGLQELAYEKLAHLFWRMAKDLATRGEPFPELAIRWSGRRRTQRSYAAMCELPLGISKDELDRRIAAFGGGDFGVSLTMVVHGHGFCYRPAHADPKAGAPGIVPGAGASPALRASIQSSGKAMV